MPRVAKVKPKKSSSLTCRGCRVRKIRCDGAQPSCGICAAYSDDCVYDKPPPMSQIVAMADKIADLENVVKQLQSQSGSASISPQEQTSPSIVDAPPPQRPHTQPPTATMPPRSRVADVEGALDETEAYYDTTSAVHAPEVALHANAASTVLTNDSSPGHFAQSLNLPTPDPAQVAFWEKTVIENGSTHLNLSRGTVRHLLATHFTWIHPVFMFVPRAMFLRDAASGGDFFSPLLLSVICLHSTRFTDHHHTESLLARAKMLLGQQIHETPNIPLVQALLQYSAREIGRGSVSQAWLYSGMAFRIAIDLGVFTETHVEHPQLEDIRNRQVSKQLAWSCFLWDKVISLYLGRTPALSEPPKWAPEFPMASDENDTWRPYTGNPSNDLTYQEVPAHTLCCFTNFCKLAVIINDVLFNIYGSRRTKQVVSFVRETRQKLHEWRSETPQFLIVDPSANDYSPPHILTQNMLYHTTIILLHRPFRGNDICRSACREAATRVEGLLLAMERSFTFSRGTYVMAYCAYTAATVAVQDSNDNVPGAQARLETCIRALNAVTASCPGIRRSIGLISKCLDSNMNQANSHMTGTGADLDANNPIPLEQMPAFPWQSADMNADFDPLPNSFSHLDNYPQEWFNLTDDMLNQFSFEIPYDGQ